MRINFDLAELQAFMAVAERLNFNAAADSLFISQSALSRRIERLEQSLGMRLIERTTRRVALTETGVQFREHARAALEELEAGVKGLSESANRRSGLVTIACIPSIANHLLPRALAAFVTQFPMVRVRVIDEGAQQVLASVVTGGADFGVNLLGTQEPDIEFEPLLTEEYLLALPQKHRLAGRRSVQWDELCEEKLISVAMSSGNRILMDNALGKLRKRPTVFYEANHIAGALAMVEAGLGVAAIPGLALSGISHPSILAVPLRQPTVKRTLGLIARKGVHLHPRAAALYDLLKHYAKTTPVVGN